MKVSDYIVSFLEEKGVNVIFGYIGGMITHLVDSIDKNTWIMTNDGIDEVMGEITRIIKQFSLMLKKN